MIKMKKANWKNTSLDEPASKLADSSCYLLVLEFLPEPTVHAQPSAYLAKVIQLQLIVINSGFTHHWWRQHVLYPNQFKPDWSK